MIKPQDQLRDWAASGVSAQAELLAIASYIDELEGCVDQAYKGLRMELDEGGREKHSEDHRLNEMTAARDWAWHLIKKRKKFTIIKE